MINPKWQKDCFKNVQQCDFCTNDSSQGQVYKVKFVDHYEDGLPYFSTMIICGVCFKEWKIEEKFHSIVEVEMI